MCLTNVRYVSSAAISIKFHYVAENADSNILANNITCYYQAHLRNNDIPFINETYKPVKIKYLINKI